MIMEFLGNQKSKTPYVVVEKTVLLLVIEWFFSVLRVWLLFTVDMDHPVEMINPSENAARSRQYIILSQVHMSGSGSG